MTEIDVWLKRDKTLNSVSEKVTIFRIAERKINTATVLRRTHSYMFLAGLAIFLCIPNCW